MRGRVQLVHSNDLHCRMLCVIRLLGWCLLAAGLAAMPAAAESMMVGLEDGGLGRGAALIVRLYNASGLAEPMRSLPRGADDVESLSYDAREGVLYAANSGVLMRIDPRTFAATVIGPTGFLDVDGLAVQPQTGVLFGVTYSGNDLIRIDKRRGTATLVNGHVEEGYRLADLAFDGDGRLWVLTSGALVQIGPYTGNRIKKLTLRGGTGLESLAWCADDGTFYSAANRGRYKDLVRVDRVTGQVTFVSPTAHSGYKHIGALAFVTTTPLVPVEMQALPAFRDADGAHLAWLARESGLVFQVHRALQPEGPWQEVASVAAPVGGRGDEWRFEHLDAEAARPELLASTIYYRVAATGADGIPAWLQLQVEAAPSAHATLLRPNAPNPFNPSTTFEVQLAAPARVEVRLFDARGRAVRRLVAGALGAGAHAVAWDGRDEAGRGLPAGVYPYVVTAGDRALHGRAVLVK